MDLKEKYLKDLNRDTLRQLIPVKAYDGESRLFYLEDGHLGFGFICKPLQGGDESVVQRLNDVSTLFRTQS